MLRRTFLSSLAFLPALLGFRKETAALQEPDHIYLGGAIPHYPAHTNPRQVVIQKFYDLYHCKSCNAKLGYGWELSNGKEGCIIDCHVLCFGSYYRSYEIERQPTPNEVKEILKDPQFCQLC